MKTIHFLKISFGFALVLACISPACLKAETPPESAAQTSQMDKAKQFAEKHKARFPIKASVNRVRVVPRRSFWMDVDVTVSVNGRVDVTYNVESKEALRGWHGQAEMRFLDDRGNVLCSHATGRTAAGATWEWYPSFVTRTWSETLPFEVLLQTHSVQIICTEKTIDTFALAKQNLEGMASITQSFVNILNAAGVDKMEVEKQLK